LIVETPKNGLKAFIQDIFGVSTFLPDIVFHTRFNCNAIFSKVSETVDKYICALITSDVYALYKIGLHSKLNG